MNPYMPIAVAIPGLFPLAMLPDPMESYREPWKVEPWKPSTPSPAPQKMPGDMGFMTAAAGWCAPSGTEYDIDPE